VAAFDRLALEEMATCSAENNAGHDTHAGIV
jgi:hypothetical protein